MPTRVPANRPMHFSILAGREVDTNSEEWRHECEVRYLAGLGLAQRSEVFEGVKEKLRGMKSVRGEAAVARLQAEIERYEALLTKA